jgi:hypothetical protein
MGFESFQVELRGEQASYLDADTTILNLPGIRPDPQGGFMRGSYYLFEDGRHVVELHLFDSPVSLSCRFTLCHPDSVDSAFLDLLRVLMGSLGMEAKICDEVRPEHEHSFPLSEFAEFSACLPEYIAIRRSEWIAAFGAARAAATTSEAFERFILPSCLPAVLQT